MAPNIGEEARRRFWERVSKKAYEYPGAGGPDAHPGVREAVQQFRGLPESEREDDVLLYWLLGSGTPPYKMSQADADYTDEASGNQTCANCEYLYEEYTSGRLICSQIRGEVSADGWCRLWEGVDNAAAVDTG